MHLWCARYKCDISTDGCDMFAEQTQRCDKSHWIGGASRAPHPTLYFVGTIHELSAFCVKITHPENSRKGDRGFLCHLEREIVVDLIDGLRPTPLRHTNVCHLPLTMGGRGECGESEAPHNYSPRKSLRTGRNAATVSS